MKDLTHKQMALAKRILEIEDEKILDSIQELLKADTEYEFTEIELSLFKERLERYDRGTGEHNDWTQVLDRLKKKFEK